MANLKKLSVVIDEEKYSELELLNLLYKHLKYSFKDINSYDELTEEEKKIFPKELFEYLTEKEKDNNGYILTYTTDSAYNGVDSVTRHFKSIVKAVEKAKHIQHRFCIDYGITDTFLHNYGDNVDGKCHYSVFNGINGIGRFITEDDNANRLIINIEKIKFED